MLRPMSRLQTKPTLCRAAALSARLFASRPCNPSQPRSRPPYQRKQQPNNDFTSNNSIFGCPPSTHTSKTAPQTPRHFPPSAQSVADERSRSFYSTVIYHGQVPGSDYKFDDSQVFGSEVKTNPTQSEANVAADRGEKDPLPMGMHRTILLGEGGAHEYTKATDSEESVHADRYQEDPLHKDQKKKDSKN